MTPTQAADWLRTHDNYLILTHLRPDGDTIGCAAGLCLSLRQLGKQAFVLPNDEVNPVLGQYLAGLLAPDSWQPERVIAVDTAAHALFPAQAAPHSHRVDLTIDHHPSQQFFAKETCLDATAAACGELVYEIARQLGPISRAAATPLYVAIATDCGCFVYGNTTARTHRIAAELMDCGIETAALNTLHFRSKTPGRLRIEGALIQGMELYEGDTLALVALSLELLHSVNATEADAEDIASLPGQLAGIRTAVTVRELSPGRCKLSLRTEPEDLNASQVCALLGGGGHAAAAGATVEGTVAQAKQAILQAIAHVRHGSQGQFCTE